MSYRPALHTPRGTWGRFLDQMRRERDWSAVQAHEELHAIFGLKIKSVASYKAIEQGQRAVSTEEAEALRAYFGKGPTNGEVQPEEEISLAAAIKALADELRLWRTEDRAKLAGLATTVDRLAAGALGSRGSAGTVTPRAPGTSRPSQRTTEQ